MILSGHAYSGKRFDLDALKTFAADTYFHHLPLILRVMSASMSERMARLCYTHGESVAGDSVRHVRASAQIPVGLRASERASVNWSRWIEI
jgi:predicted acylesterase/phospholipase RssA